MSRQMRRAPALLLACALGAATPSTALADEPPVSTVKVTGIKDPDMRSYRNVAAGLDAFDAYRAFAPAASLRFRLMHGAGGYASGADGVTLRLDLDDSAVTIPIEPDGSFVIARNQAADDDDASFVLNQKQGAYVAWPEVRTPGLPDNVRRLGDLRLECRIVTAMVQQQISFLAKLAMNALMKTPDWCGKAKFTYGMRVGARLAGASIRYGERHHSLDVQEWTYGIPIGDASWPDEALVELSYAPAAAPPAQPATP